MTHEDAMLIVIALQHVATVLESANDILARICLIVVFGVLVNVARLLWKR